MSDLYNQRRMRFRRHAELVDSQAELLRDRYIELVHEDYYYEISYLSLLQKAALFYLKKSNYKPIEQDFKDDTSSQAAEDQPEDTEFTPPTTTAENPSPSNPLHWKWVEPEDG